jgi:pimeloyl-ACP methyl ester carboxylesterase
VTTFVLIHGASQGGWIWQPTAMRLRGMGHLVHAPSLDGCGERRHALRPGITVDTHAIEIADLMFYEDLHDVVLTGTSSGGMVLCRAAELARERIARLVFVDALALLDGERIGEIVNRTGTRVTTPLAVGSSREDAESRMFGALDPELRAWAVARYTLHPIAAMEEPVELKNFWSQSWPGTTVIRCRRSANPPEAHQRRTAEKLNGKYLELDAGHYPMLSDADALVPLLTQG